MKIELVNRTGTIKTVKCGFSWTVFFFGFFFGIPLFIRKLFWQGGVMAFLMIIYYWATFSARYIEFAGRRMYFMFGQQIHEDDFQAFIIAYFVIYFVISIYFAIKANKWYAQNLIQDGFVPRETGEEAIKRFAKFAEIDFNRLNSNIISK